MTCNDKFKKLIQGDEYDDKIWLGLDNTDSLIANYVYQDFLTQTDIRLSAGAKKVNPENANQTPIAAAASQNFIKQYQGNIYKSLLSMVILLTITDAMI
jgi:type II secretory pathway component PulK